MDKTNANVDSEKIKSGDSSARIERKSISDEAEASENSLASISEHIVQIYSANDETSQRDLSIPSLNLKSPTKSDTGTEDYPHSGDEKSKFSMSHDSISRKDGSVSKVSPEDSLESKNLESGSSPVNSLSKNDIHEDRISVESSLHAQLDLSITSKSSSFEPLKQKDSINNSRSAEISGAEKESNVNFQNRNESKESSLSEDIIKIDIRGTAAEKFPFEKRILVYQTLTEMPQITEKDDFIALNNSIVNLTTLQPLSIRKLFNKLDDPIENNESKVNKNIPETKPNEEFEQDYAIEELILNESRDTFPSDDNDENIFAYNNAKPPTEGESSISTITTDYKTLCEDLPNKIPEVLRQREILIDELKIKLDHSAEQKEKMQLENEYLASEISKLQQILSVVTSAGEENKGHLSDFAKHEIFSCGDNNAIIEKSNCNTQNENSKIDPNIVRESPLKDSIHIFKNIEEELNEEQLKLFHTFEDFFLNVLENEINDRNKKLLSKLNDFKNNIDNSETKHRMEIDRLKNLIFSIKTENPDLLSLRTEMQNSHKNEMEQLRTYFEQKCSEMEKHYSEEVFSQQSKKQSNNSSTDSLNNCLEAMPFGSPFHSANVPFKKIQRSYSAEFQMGIPSEKYDLENTLKHLKNKHDTEIESLSKQYESQINEINLSRELYLQELDSCKDQIAELKAHLQTYQNTVMDDNLYLYNQPDTDLELEKERVPPNIELKVQDENQQPKVLLSDPNLSMNSCSLNLITLKEKIEYDNQLAIEKLKAEHIQELAALRDKSSKLLVLESEKYAEKEIERREKRYEAFDKNRRLEDVVKERDGLRQLTSTLQKVLSQLVEYFNLCEDELNNTFVGELLKQVVVADENCDDTIVLNFKKDDRSSCSDNSFENDDRNINTISFINNVSTKMHFAPDVHGIITYIDPEHSMTELECSQDVSINFKNHLDACLKRLRTEAQELVALSANKIQKRLSILSKDDEKILYMNNDTSNNLEYKNDEDGIEALKNLYNESESHRKALEKELEIAMVKISDLMSDQLLNQSKEVISEGYGIVIHPRTPVSLPPHPRVAITSPPPLLENEGNTPDSGRSVNTDDAIDKKVPANHNLIRRLNNELEVTTREKEDFQMQLEAANKQLRSTRQFLEEQASERELERDEFQRELEVLKDENSKLVIKAQQHTRICKEVEQLEAQIREMSNLVSSLETQKNDIGAELKISNDKINCLRDIIGNLETQLESKAVSELNILKELGSYKEIADERHLKITDVSKELDTLKEHLAERMASDVLAAGERHAKSVACELETEKKLVEQMRSQLHVLVDTIMEHTTALENLHEAICSQSCSSPSEDVSIPNHKEKPENESKLENLSIIPPCSPDKLMLQLPLLEISRLGDTLHKHLKAEEAALKRISDLEMQLVQLKDVSQELRTERDILQERMSEQSLKISSLQARLDQTRHTAEAMRHQTTEELRLQLDEALSETQLLREALDARDKQVAHLKSLFESSKKRLGEQEHELNSCAGSNKEIVQRLRREIEEQRSKITELHDALELKLSLPENLEIHSPKQQPFQFENHELMRELSNCENKNDEGKLSARTLSDILSISEFDEADVVLRRAEINPQACLSTDLQISFNPIKNQNETLLTGENYVIIDSQPIGEVNAECLQDKNISLENTRYNFDHHKDLTLVMSKGNITDAALSFRKDHSSEHKESSKNCSLFPNNNISADRDVSIKPKQINFSMSDTSAKNSNKMIESANGDLNSRIQINDMEVLKLALGEIGIEIENKTYQEVILDLRNKIFKLLVDIQSNERALLSSEEKLIAFPIITNEMEDLRMHLQNSLKTMQEDKIYYNTKLEEFDAKEKELRGKLEEALKELNMFKNDVIKKEKLILELEDEKNNLQQSLLDLEQKYKDLFDSLNEGKIKNRESSDVMLLEQTISEKNQQIDNLNANLDKLDVIERELNQSREYIESLNTELEKKCAEVNELSKIIEDYQREEQLSKKDTSVIVENDLMGENQVDNKNTDLADMISITNEQINQNQILIDSHKTNENIILSLQAKLISEGKKLNIKAFDLAEANSNIKDLQNKCDDLQRYASEKDELVKEVIFERDELRVNLKTVLEKLQEEGNMEDMQSKLLQKSEDCAHLEYEVASLRNVIEKFHNDRSIKDQDSRFTLLSIENTRLRDQLYTLEEKLAEQNNLISQLNSVKDNLCSDINMLQEKREAEKDASTKLKILLNSEKKLLSNVQAQDSGVIQLLKSRLEESLDSESELKVMLERERKNSEQLMKQVTSHRKQVEHMLDVSENHGETIDNHSISLMAEKLNNVTSLYEDQIEISNLLKREIMLEKSKRDREKSRLLDLQNTLDREKLWFQKEIDTSKEQISNMKQEISNLNAQKHEMHSELIDLRKRLDFLMSENVNLENKLSNLYESHKLSSNAPSNLIAMEDFEPQKLTNEESHFGRDFRIDRGNRLNLLYGGYCPPIGENVTSDTNSITLQHLKEMQALLKRHISENVQISETVKDLNQERRELQLRIKELEHKNMATNTIKHASSMINLPSDVDQQVRFLYSRFMRMHSYRKQLIFQKQYLVLCVTALTNWEKKLTNCDSSSKPPRPKYKFKCIVIVVRSIIRLRYLVKRWHTGSKLAANMHLNVPNVFPTELRSSKSYTHLPSYMSGIREKSSRMRNSMTNPMTMFQATPTKSINKSWSSGIAGNSNAADNLLNQHTANYVTNPHYFGRVSDSRDAPLNENRWFSMNNPQFVRASHPELHEFAEEEYPLRNLTSDNETSPLAQQINSLDAIPKNKYSVSRERL